MVAEFSLLNLFIWIRYITILVLSSVIAKYLISFLLPKQITDPFDRLVLGMRAKISGFVEQAYKDTTNFEVVFTSRIVAPIGVLFFVDSMLTSIWNRFATFNFSLLLFIIYILLKIYLFLNIGPSKDDTAILFQSTNVTKLFFLVKLFFFYFLENVLRVGLGVLGLSRIFKDDFLIFYLILLFPLSSFLMINQLYSPTNDVEVETISDASQPQSLSKANW